MTFIQALTAGLIASGIILSCATSEGKLKPRTGKKVAMEYLKTDQKFKKQNKKKREPASIKKSKKQKKSAPKKRKR